MPVQISSSAQLLPRKRGMLEILASRLLPQRGRDVQLERPLGFVERSEGPITPMVSRALPLQGVGERLLAGLSDPGMDVMPQPMGALRGAAQTEKTVARVWDLLMSDESAMKMFKKIQKSERGELIDPADLLSEISQWKPDSGVSLSAWINSRAKGLLDIKLAEESRIASGAMELNRPMASAEGDVATRELAASGRSVEEAAITSEALAQAGGAQPVVADPRLQMGIDIGETLRPPGGRAAGVVPKATVGGELLDVGARPGVRKWEGQRLDPARPIANLRANSLRSIAEDFGYGERSGRAAELGRETRMKELLNTTVAPTPTPLLSLKKTLNTARQPVIESLIDSSNELNDLGKRAVRSYLYGGSSPHEVVRRLGTDEPSLRRWMEVLIEKGGFVK